MVKYQFDHIHLNSANPANTADFYVRRLGAVKKADRKLPDGRALLELSLDGVTIYITDPRPQPLTPAAPQTKPGLDHFAVRTDSIQEAMDELKASGSEILTGVMGGGNLKYSYFKGPDGVVVELLERSE